MVVQNRALQPWYNAFDDGAIGRRRNLVHVGQVLGKVIWRNAGFCPSGDGIPVHIHIIILPFAIDPFNVRLEFGAGDDLLAIGPQSIGIWKGKV
jgi:hypothetical protein